MIACQKNRVEKARVNHLVKCLLWLTINKKTNLNQEKKQEKKKERDNLQMYV